MRAAPLVGEYTPAQYSSFEETYGALRVRHFLLLL